jgi:hypothetical protein
LKRRLFWTGVVFALTLIWLTVQVVRVAGAIASAARRPFPPRLQPVGRQKCHARTREVRLQDVLLR